MTRQPQDHSLQLHGCPAVYQTVPPGPAAADLPPLLLIHGISCCIGTWAPFIQVWSQRDDAPALLVPDLPAHGGTACPKQILGMPELADWVEALTRTLGMGPVDVLGHSMGGQVALALADRYPERVRRLTLLGPTTGGRHVSMLRNFGGLLADSAREPLSYNGLLTRMFWRMGPLRYLLTAQAMQRDDAFERAARVRAPALVLQGERDAIIPPRAAQELARVFRAGAYTRVPGAHAAQYTHAVPTADRVLAFLREPE